jgi:hypothetical protein
MNIKICINHFFSFIPGIQLLPAKGTLAIAAASTVSAHKSSGSRLCKLFFPHALAKCLRFKRHHF